MPLHDLLQVAQRLEIQAYQKPTDLRELRRTHVAFSGSPYKHPHNPDKVILVSDPFCAITFYYEFLSDDITYVEELPNLVSDNGKVIPMVRVWVKKKSIAMRCTPFLVDDLGAA